MLIVEHVVGYMLKVLKSGQEITKYKDEFNAIKHGDYRNFLRYVGGPLPFQINWSDGRVNDESNNPNFDCDFEGLLKCGPSIRIFYNKCFSEYGIILDNEISDEVYYKVVAFEISLRMHANNHNLLNNNQRLCLVEVINMLSKFKSIPIYEIENLQASRRFINKIKHQKKQIPTWQDGINQFLKGWDVLVKYQLTII